MRSNQFSSSRTHRIEWFYLSIHPSISPGDEKLCHNGDQKASSSWQRKPYQLTWRKSKSLDMKAPPTPVLQPRVHVSPPQLWRHGLVARPVSSTQALSLESTTAICSASKGRFATLLWVFTITLCRGIQRNKNMSTPDMAAFSVKYFCLMFLRNLFSWNSRHSYPYYRVPFQFGWIFNVFEGYTVSSSLWKTRVYV